MSDRIARRREVSGGPRELRSEGDLELGGLVFGIYGPTASGKTAVAAALARRIRAEVVSADSMQVYRGLPILSNQTPIPGVRTHLVAIWELDHEGSVGEYAGSAHAAVDGILARGATPIVAGGTGLYLRAALAELALPPPPEPGARARWEQVYDRLGPTRTHAVLAARDPAGAAAVHPNDRRRVVRALELADAGRSLRPARDRLWTAEARHPTVLVALDVPGELLARRIEERAHAMLAAGAAQEARRALSGPLSTTAAQTIGLVEATTLPEDEAAAAIARRTRRLAAAQRKWLRRLEGAVSLRGDRPAEEIADEILEVARARQRLPARRAG